MTCVCLCECVSVWICSVCLSILNQRTYLNYAHVTMRMLLLLACDSNNIESLSPANRVVQQNPATVHQNDTNHSVYVEHLTRNEKKQRACFLYVRL